MTTPSINAAGRFVFKAPYDNWTGVTYTVTAIREFEDIYARGDDVYLNYYVPMGLINNAVVEGETFSFADEVERNPSIVSLSGSDGTVRYVPTTYILEVPTASDIVYSRLLVLCDLGLLPDELDVTDIVDDVNQMVSARVGINAQTQLVKAPADAQPTMDEHAQLENSRTGSIAVYDNNYTQYLAAKKQLELVLEQNKVMAKLLADAGLLEGRN